MERKRNHRNDRIQIYLYYAVIKCCIARNHLLEALRTLVNLKILFYLIIRRPHRRQTGRLGCHRINTVSEIH